MDKSKDSKKTELPFPRTLEGLPEDEQEEVLQLLAEHLVLDHLKRQHEQHGTWTAAQRRMLYALAEAHLDPEPIQLTLPLWDVADETKPNSQH